MSHVILFQLETYFLQNDVRVCEYRHHLPDSYCSVWNSTLKFTFHHFQQNSEYALVMITQILDDFATEHFQTILRGITAAWLLCFVTSLYIVFSSKYVKNLQITNILDQFETHYFQSVFKWVIALGISSNYLSKQHVFLQIIQTNLVNIFPCVIRFVL